MKLRTDTMLVPPWRPRVGRFLTLVANSVAAPRREAALRDGGTEASLPKLESGADGPGSQSFGGEVAKQELRDQRMPSIARWVGAQYLFDGLLHRRPHPRAP